MSDFLLINFNFGSEFENIPHQQIRLFWKANPPGGAEKGTRTSADRRRYLPINFGPKLCCLEMIAVTYIYNRFPSSSVLGACTCATLARMFCLKHRCILLKICMTRFYGPKNSFWLQFLKKTKDKDVFSTKFLKIQYISHKNRGRPKPHVTNR